MYLFRLLFSKPFKNEKCPGCGFSVPQFTFFFFTFLLNHIYFAVQKNKRSWLLFTSGSFHFFKGHQNSCPTWTTKTIFYTLLHFLLFFLYLQLRIFWRPSLSKQLQAFSLSSSTHLLQILMIFCILLFLVFFFFCVFFWKFLLFLFLWNH